MQRCAWVHPMMFGPFGRPTFLTKVLQIRMVLQPHHLGGLWFNLRWPLWFSLSECWMHLAKVCLGASNEVWAIWLPNISNQSSPDQNGVTTPSSWWVLNVPKLTFVICTFWVLDAYCKGVPGCIQCSYGHLVAQHFQTNFSRSEWCQNTIILESAEWT